MTYKIKSNSPEVAVIGSGLCGCCIALELARQGYQVELIDQDSKPMNRAGRRNEGKIHLGLIYAEERSAATASVVLQENQSVSISV